MSICRGQGLDSGFRVCVQASRLRIGDLGLSSDLEMWGLGLGLCSGV